MAEARRTAIWVKCTGEAHSNPFIDHCGVCMPHWGEFPTCPYCKSSRIKEWPSGRGKCKQCGKIMTMRG